MTLNIREFDDQVKWYSHNFIATSSDEFSIPYLPEKPKMKTSKLYLTAFTFDPLRLKEDDTLPMGVGQHGEMRYRSLTFPDVKIWREYSDWYACTRLLPAGFTDGRQPYRSGKVPTEALEKWIRTVVLGE